jgi:hypothetical protein
MFVGCLTVVFNVCAVCCRRAGNAEPKESWEPESNVGTDSWSVETIAKLKSGFKNQPPPVTETNKRNTRKRKQ